MKQRVANLKIQWLVAVSALFALLSASAGNAATLYERSVAALEVNAQKASPQDFTFVVLGDNKDNDRIFKKTLNAAAAFNPLFILHEGDISEKGTQGEIDRFLEIVQETVPAIPLFVVPGNHEQKSPFVQKIGPLAFSFEIARLGLKIVGLDNSGYVLKPAQLKYLEDQLDHKRKFTFVTMHIPPITDRWTWHAFSDGAPQLIALVAEKKVSAVFYGHIHMYDREDIRGVPHIISGGAGATLSTIGFPGEPSYHIVVVKVRGGAVTYQMVKIKE